MKKKICIISDIHGDMRDLTGELAIPKHDLLIIAGDIVPLGIQTNFPNCIKWLNNEFKNWVKDMGETIIVWGNHDFVGQVYQEEMKNELDQTIQNLGVVLLQNSSTQWNGINIYGTSAGNYPHGWAFREIPEKQKELFDQIPENTDILITHEAPVLGNYDTVWTYHKFKHVGSEELAMAVRNKKPKYHFFGHVHEGDHTMKQIGGTYYCNVSVKDEYYATVNKPFVFEYEIM